MTAEKKHLQIQNNIITISDELFNYIGNNFFFLETAENLFIRPIDPINISKYLLTPFTSRKLTLAKKAKNTTSNQGVIYSFNNKTIKNGEYKTAKYGKSILLIEQISSEEAADRETFWSKIENYHEHLHSSDQNSSTMRVTEWLTGVIMNHRPSSVLELGCGAGRNILHLNSSYDDLELHGIDINRKAIDTAKSQLIQNGNKTSFEAGSVLDLSRFGDESIDVVFTSGLLMHIPENECQKIITEMLRISRKAIINFELHGPSHAFDYHRYPRDYSQLYDKLLLSGYEYTIFPANDFRSVTTESFKHALLVKQKTLSVS